MPVCRGYLPKNWSGISTTNKDGAEDIIEDIGLSVCASTFFIKGGMTLIESRLGKWVIEKIGSTGDNIAKFSENLGKWFSSEGEITGTAAKIFGKNAETFMKTRLGPVCAIASTVLSGFFLKDSIDNHDTFNTVMESLNLTFAARLCLIKHVWIWQLPISQIYIAVFLIRTHISMI